MMEQKSSTIVSIIKGFKRFVSPNTITMHAHKAVTIEIEPQKNQATGEASSFLVRVTKEGTKIKEFNLRPADKFTLTHQFDFNFDSDRPESRLFPIQITNDNGDIYFLRKTQKGTLILTK